MKEKEDYQKQLGIHQTLLISEIDRYIKEN